MDFEINDFPLEVIVKVFSFLSDHELLRCTQVCRKWYYAARHPHFYKKLVLQSSDRENYSALIQTFRRAEIFPFNHLYLASPCNELKAVVEFCKQRYETFRHLHVWINSYRDLNGLQSFKNVQHLEISPRLLLRRDNELVLADDFRMESVKTLQLNENLMSISITETLIDRFPNICSVILNFDPHGDSLSAFQVLLPRLKMLAQRRGDVKFVFNDLDRPKKINRNADELIRYFINNPLPNLIVNRLWLWLPSLNVNLLPVLTVHQNSIKSLPIHANDCLTNELLSAIGVMFPKLEHIKLEAIRKWDVDNFLDALLSCKNLTSIQLYFGTLNQNGVIQLSSSKDEFKFRSMKSFVVRYTSLEFDLNSFDIALRSFPMLIELELLSCHTVDDHILQIIVKNCRGLKILKIISCDEISDNGIMGEIIDDSGNNGLPLSVLSHLEVLSLSKCTKITNMSLSHSFKFKSLKGLDLTGLDKISTEGISQMTRECPFIEKLKLDGCKSLTNDAVDIISKNLKLLKVLYLNQCPHLTEICLSEIVDRCKNIQRVEIVLPTFPKSRRTIHYFKMGIFHIMHCTREGHLAYTPPEYCEQYLNSRESTINRWRY
uniref:CSON014151 protein n=1 Tax=Culicoides sonorensis TaxID=179676 RepID=A0A336MM35_CULSO